MTKIQNTQLEDNVQNPQDIGRDTGLNPAGAPFDPILENEKRIGKEAAKGTDERKAPEADNRSENSGEHDATEEEHPTGPKTAHISDAV